MAKQRKMIYLVSAVLFVMLIAVQAFQMRQEGLSSALSFCINTDKTGQKITLWECETGGYYVFLPGFAQLDQVQIVLNTAEKLRIGDVILTHGMDCSSFLLDTSYELSYTYWGIPRTQTITFLQSKNVASLFLDTESGSMDYVHRKKDQEESGSITLYTCDGVLNFAGTLESVNGRGNHTWENFEKKPYSIKLTREADLLGMGAAQKWILLANADDTSNMRNKIVYDFADQVGAPYSPDSDWVDLYLNGEYAGLYLLCERNEIHPERVAVDTDGSFLVSLERKDRLINQGYPHISTQNQQYLRIHSSEDAVTADRIRGTIQRVENAILAEDGIDPETGKHWTELINVESWVNKYLVEEVFGNGDACYISQFFYTDGDVDGRVYAGPVWDFDHCIGTPAGWALMYPNSLYANRLYVKSGYSTPWFYNLYQKDAFYEAIIEKYRDQYLPALDVLVSEKIFEYADHISSAATMNRVRWSQPDVSTQEEVDYLCDFLKKRIQFLSDIWINSKQYCVIRVDQGFGAFYGYIMVEPGEIFDGLPVLDGSTAFHFEGWFDEKTGLPFDASQPVTSDMQLYAKWEKSISNTLDDYIKLLPLVLLGIFGMVFLGVDIKRNGKDR